MEQETKKLFCKNCKEEKKYLWSGSFKFCLDCAPEDWQYGTYLGDLHEDAITINDICNTNDKEIICAECYEAIIEEPTREQIIDLIIEE